MSDKEGVTPAPDRMGEIEARCEKATKGPWSHHKDACKCEMVMCADGSICDVTKGKWGDEYPTLKMEGGSLDRSVVAVMEMIEYGEVPEAVFLANRDFIANARDDIPYLLSQAKAAEAANMSKDDFQKIAEKVAAGYGGIGGLSHGLHLDFAYDCFRAAYEKSREGL